MNQTIFSQKVSRRLARVGGAIVVAALISAGLPGCTDEEVATTVGIVAIGAGIGIIAAGGDNDNHDHDHNGYGHDHGHYECQGGYKTVCTSYRDYYGCIKQDCRQTYDSCDSRVWVNNSMALKTLEEVADADPVSATKTVSNNEGWGTTFAMSFDSADKLVNALNQSKAGDTKALASLGLSRDDVHAMAQMKMPSQAGLDAMAKTLDQDTKATADMVQRLLAKAQEQRQKSCHIVTVGRSNMTVCN